MATYKQKCWRCKTNYAITSSRNRFVTCYDCQKKELQGEIADPVMKKMFEIPEEYYMRSPFLRDIKKKYILYKSLSEKQVEAFKKTVQRFEEAETEGKKDAKKEAGTTAGKNRAELKGAEEKNEQKTAQKKGVKKARKMAI